MNSYKIIDAEERARIADSLRCDMLQHPHIVYTAEQDDTLFGPRMLAIKTDEHLEIYLDAKKVTVELSKCVEATEEEIIKTIALLYYSTIVYINADIMGNEGTSFIYDIEKSRTYSPPSLHYESNLLPDEDNKILVTSRPTHKKFETDFLKEQIRSRYGFFDRPRSGLLNVVMDSYLPGLLYRYDMNIENMLKETNIPKTAVAISPLISDIFNLKQVPITELVRVLGYTQQDIKAILTAVKKKNLDFVFAGTGGTGLNTAYWFNKLTEMTDTINLFNSVTVFEKEEIEFSNILRFPIPLSAYSQKGGNRKVNLIRPLLQRLTNRETTMHRRYIEPGGGLPYEFFNTEFIEDKDGNFKEYRYRAKPNTIIYGAPSIETRDYMSSLGNFICATHAATTCSIWLNPSQDQEIQVESYGIIQLGPFFMNQLKMAISTLEILGSDQDLTEKDTSLLEYEFNGEIQLKTQRKYNWQITKDLTMMTETEANQI